MNLLSIRLTLRWKLKPPGKVAISVMTYSPFKKEHVILKTYFPSFMSTFFTYNTQFPQLLLLSKTLLGFWLSLALCIHSFITQHTLNYISKFFFCSRFFSYEIETWKPVWKPVIFVILLPAAITVFWLFPPTSRALAQSIRGRTAP